MSSSNRLGNMSTIPTSPSIGDTHLPLSLSGGSNNHSFLTVSITDTFDDYSNELPSSGIVGKGKASNTIREQSTSFEFTPTVPDDDDDYYEYTNFIQGPDVDSGYQKGWINTKTYVKSIINDLSTIAIPDDVKVKAEAVYNELGCPTHKGNRRKELVFFCVYQAFIILDSPRDKKEIADMVGLPHSQISNANSIASVSTSVYRKKSKRYTPFDYLDKHLVEVNIEECLPDVERIANRILRNDPDLKDSRPQVVSMAIIKYYMVSNGIKFRVEDLAKVIQRSPTTLEAVYKKVVEADNM